MNTQDLIQIDNILKKRLKNFATKKDLKNFATKKDLKNFATKKDLSLLKNDLIERMDNLEMNIVETVDKHKADKEQVQNLEERVVRLETHLQTA